MRKEKKSKKQNKEIHEQYQPSNSWIPIEDINYGMLIMKEGARKRYLKIVEVTPVNFSMKSESKRVRLVEQFTAWTKIAPKNFQIFIESAETDISDLVRNTKMAGIDEAIEKVEHCRYNNYLPFIEKMASVDSTSRRFYITFEYEGSKDGTRLHTLTDIATYMDMEVRRIASNFTRMGMSIVLHDDENVFIGSLLYRLLNPQTSKKCSFSERLRRVKNDAEKYRKTLQVRDAIAPTAVDTTHAGYLILDGIYFTFLCVSSEGYPSLKPLPAGWMQVFTGFGSNVSVSMQNWGMNNELIMNRLDHAIINNDQSIRMNGMQNNRGAEKAAQQKTNNSFLFRYMKEYEENLYSSSILLMARADTLKQMKVTRRSIRDELRMNSFHVNECYNRCEDAFFMMLPFLRKSDDIMQKSKHNFLSSTIGSSFPFTAYEMMDPTGAVLGINGISRSLCALNPFNTKRLNNANAVITGSSGAGKTFVELLLSGRFRMLGMRIMFILPLKAHEYVRGIERLGGEFIQLGPDMDSCINIFEIRPEAGIEVAKLIELLSEKETGGGGYTYKSPSRRAMKIREIKSFYSLLLRMNRMEISAMDVHLVNLYDAFGITNENESIYDSDGNLKIMPIFSDFYNEIKDDPVMRNVCEVTEPFIKGSFKNFNGQTNVDVDNPMTAFDVNEELIGKDMLPPVIFLANSLCYSVAKRDITEPCLIFNDEIWKMIGSPETAEMVIEQYKILRGYGSGIWGATQEAENLAKLKTTSGDSFSNTIMNCSEIKIALRAIPDEAAIIQRMMKLTNLETDQITKFTRGQGLLIAGGDRVNVSFIATQEEIHAFTTDPVLIKELIKEKEKGKEV